MVNNHRHYVDNSIQYLTDANDYPATSRYVLMRVINQDTDQYLETFNQKVIPDEDADQYHVVKVGEENRLDIIAYNYYNDSSLWWAIALANEMVDPFTVPAKTMIRIPPMSSLLKSTNEILNMKF